MSSFGIVVGIPQSGKSTFCRHLHETEGWVIINPDTYRQVLSGSDRIQLLSPADEGKIWRCVELTISSLLRSDQDVILDATNIEKRTRSRWRKLAVRNDAQFVIFLLEPDLELSIERNRRNRRFLDEKGDPDDIVIRRMFEKFERPDPSEGRIVDVEFDR